MNKIIKKIYLGLFSLVLAVAIVDCKQDSALMSEPEIEPRDGEETPTVGTLMYSELLKDDQLIEQCVDSLVNLGTDVNPAYFYVNVSHTVNGIEIDERFRENCVYNSITLDELENFIAIYSKTQYLTANTMLTDEEKTTAYQDLYFFLKEHNLDAAELINATKDNQELLESTIACGKIVPLKEPDPFDFTIPDSLLPDFTNYEYYSMIDTADSIRNQIDCYRDKLILPLDIKEKDENNTKHDPYNKNTFVSYINKNDFNFRNYYDTQYFDSPKYTCRYGTKGHPMVLGEFYIHGWYKSKHKGDTKTIYYIPYLKTLITNVHIGLSMKMTGSATYNYNGVKLINETEFATTGSGEINVEYGDSWAVKRKAKLKFLVDAYNGFEELSWTDNL
jgi:hypothetical protein